MATKIRLRRMGKKKQAHYRIVVADSRSPRDGRFVENLGYYNPIPHPARLSVDLERVDYWLGEGAEPSATVASLLSKARNGGDDKVALAGVLAVEPETNGAREVASSETATADERPEDSADAVAEPSAGAEGQASSDAEVGAKAESEAAESAADAGGEAAEPANDAGTEAAGPANDADVEVATATPDADTDVEASKPGNDASGEPAAGNEGSKGGDGAASPSE